MANVFPSGSSSQQSHSRIPDITRSPEQWFRYFDYTHSGVLDKQSVVNGFVQTFPSIDKDVLSSIILEMWPIFDHDGNGSITIQEFLARDGLCDTLVAQMNPHFNEIDAPNDDISPYSPTTSYQAPPAYQAPPPPTYGYQSPQASYSAATLQLRCGHCGNLQTTTPPPSARNFIALCGTCGAQNQKMATDISRMSIDNIRPIPNDTPNN